MRDYDTGEVTATKEFLAGAALGLIAQSSPAVILFELDNWGNEAMKWQLKVINYNERIPVIFMGENRYVSAMSRELQRDDRRMNNIQRRILIFVDEEPCFGFRDESSLAKDIHVLLVTPPGVRLPSHRPYIALRGVPVMTEVYDYLLQLLGLPHVDHNRNMVYVPCKARLLDFIATTTAVMNVRLRNWCVHVVKQTELCDNKELVKKVAIEVAKQIDHFTDVEADRDQQNRVLAMITYGETVTLMKLRAPSQQQRNQPEPDILGPKEAPAVPSSLPAAVTTQEDNTKEEPPSPPPKRIRRVSTPEQGDRSPAACSKDREQPASKRKPAKRAHTEEAAVHPPATDKGGKPSKKSKGNL